AICGTCAEFMRVCRPLSITSTKTGENIVRRSLPNSTTIKVGFRITAAKAIRNRCLVPEQYHLLTVQWKHSVVRKAMKRGSFTTVRSKWHGKPEQVSVTAMRGRLEPLRDMWWAFGWEMQRAKDVLNLPELQV